MLKVILVDDEENALESLSEQLKLYHNNVFICELCRTVNSAVSAIKKHEPDLIFLDIELGKESGFDIFKHYPKPNFKVIFITAHEKYAIQAIRFAAFDYLLKPVDRALLAEGLKKTIDDINHNKLNINIASYLHNINSSEKNSKKIILKTADAVYLVHIRDIVYCEAHRSYTTFHISDKSRIVVSTTLGDYEEILSDHGFFRIHQSFLLNLSYFKRYEKSDGGKAILKDNSSLPVATRKREQLIHHLSNL